MKLGISIASLYPMETEKSLDYLGEHGVSVTEIFFNSPCELQTDFVAELDRIRNKHSIEIASVHPCGSLAEPYLLFSDYKRRYKEGFEFYKKYYQAAQRLGAKTVVLHGDSFLGHICAEEYYERLAEMNDEAKKYGVCISHENVNRYRAAMPEFVEKLNQMSNFSMKYTFDVKQCVRAGCDVYDMYNAMGKNIINVHISDHSLKGDCLLPMQGDFDFRGLFDRLSNDGYDGACLIEVYRHAYNEYSELTEAYKSVREIFQFE